MQKFLEVEIVEEKATVFSAALFKCGHFPLWAPV